ncbi:hypothetical protein J4Q44_G00030210 [Coregonus suidteri]|uniref:Uncharacterized protein n=1 Tax=Coregonus suidteri TaxID=861788 RepID=A0AAN8NGZ6_9TELE
MDYHGNGEMLTNRDVNKFVHKILEKLAFVRMENSWNLISAHETWDQHFTCCVYIFVQYSLLFYYKYSSIQSSRNLLTRTYITVYWILCTYKNGK